MNLTKKALLLSYISVASASAAIITPALPVIESKFHLSHGALEWIITLFLLGYMAGQLVYGPLSNRFGRLKALRAGFLLNLVGILICLLSLLSNSYGLLLFGRLVTALGAAAGLSCTFTLVNELMSEEEAKQSLSYAVLSFTIGIGLSIFIGGLITQYLNWTIIFWVLMLHGLLMLLSTWLFQETLTEQKPIHVTAILEGYLSAFKSKELVIFALFLGLVSVFSYCYSTAAPMIAHAYLGLSPAQYGSWNSLTMVGMLLGSLVAARVLKHLTTSHVLQLSMALIILGLISFILQLSLDSHSTFWFFLTATYLYFFASWLFPCASHSASNAIQDKANASGAMNFINMGSASLSVTVMGYIPFSQFTALILIVGLFIGTCVALYLLNLKALNAG